MASLLLDTPPLLTPQQTCLPCLTLEGLPEEIKCLLLRHLPDGLALRALVHSSPLYHASYLSQRHSILCSVLLNDIRPEGLFLAYVLEEASNFRNLDPEDVKLPRRRFLDRFFSQHRLPLSEGYHLQNTDLYYIVSMFRRQYTIYGVASQYFTEMLLVNLVTREKVQSYKPPSCTEINRLYRALYHIEIYCNLFLSTRPPEEGRREGQLIVLAGIKYLISQKFVPNIPVLDAHGLACIREYLFNYYTKLWKSCEAEMQKYECSPDSRLPVLEGKYALFLLTIILGT